MNKIIKNLSIGWDGENWGRCFEFWNQYLSFSDKKVLELGCGCENGGLSLWAAHNGASEILCSDYSYPIASTLKIHEKYNFKSVINYIAIYALKIHYEN